MHHAVQHLRRHGVAYVALFVALSGTSYAAVTTRLPANSVGTTQVINHSLLKMDFKRGQLPRGPRGLRGPEGFAGPRGLIGPQGPTGKQGPPGDRTFVETLPAWKTVRGEWAVIEQATAAGQQFGDSITFQYPLPSAPVAHYIEAGQPAPAGCLGNVLEPGAEPGNLCIFEQEPFNAVRDPQICNWLNGSCTGPSRLGFTVVPTSFEADVMEVDGTWAVTAPVNATTRPRAHLSAP